MNRFKQFKEAHPFTSLLLIAIVVRLAVIIFYPGYGALYEIQRPSLTRTLITDIQSWMSNSLCGEIGLKIISRCFYCLISLLIVSFFYRICDLLTNKKQTAWILALLPVICCVMPSFGIISNPNAFLATPLMLYGGMIILRQEVLRQAEMNSSIHRTSFFIAGLALGLACCIWYQCGLIALSLLILLYLLKNRKGTWFTLLGVLASIIFIVALVFLISSNPLKYFGL